MAVYMAVDYGNSDSWNDYMIDIGFLKRLLQSDDHCGAELLGDYNADLRYMKSRFARQLDTFVTEYNMTIVGMRDSQRLDSLSTWHSGEFSTETWINYFIVSKSLESMVDDFEILEDGMCVRPLENCYVTCTES